MARQRYCRRLLRYRNNLRVSADPVAKPAAHTRAESRGSPRTRAAWGERQTRRWRKPDSNHQSRVTRARFQTASFPSADFSSQEIVGAKRNLYGQGRRVSFRGPGVRSRFPPPLSLSQQGRADTVGHGRFWLGQAVELREPILARASKERLNKGLVHGWGHVDSSAATERVNWGVLGAVLGCLLVCRAGRGHPMPIGSAADTGVP
jgi:hypothetical protein